MKIIPTNIPDVLIFEPKVPGDHRGCFFNPFGRIYLKITVIVKLDDRNHRQLWVPKGFAHGYLVLSETAVFACKCDNYYAPEYDGGMMWNDPALKIDWLLPGRRYQTISIKPVSGFGYQRNSRIAIINGVPHSVMETGNV